VWWSVRRQSQRRQVFADDGIAFKSALADRGHVVVLVIFSKETKNNRVD
jgi:hypothetical protein